MKPKLITSWDDGRKQDIRLAELLLKYNIPAIFYIPTSCELSEDEIRLLAKDFEIGGHTATHPMDMKLLTWEQIEAEVESNKLWLESVIRQPVNSFCYPRGRFDERVITTLKKVGFRDGRTTVVLSTDWPKDVYRTATTVHVYPRQEYHGEPWLDVAKRLYSEAKAKEDGYFHVWGHSWEIDKLGLWEETEQLFQFLAGELTLPNK